VASMEGDMRMARAVLGSLFVAGCGIAMLLSGPAEADTGGLAQQEAWRARLVSLAPACGLKDGAWAAGFRQAIALEVHAKYYAERRFMGRDEPSEDEYTVAEGDVAMAEDLGRRLFARYGADACKALATPDSVSEADRIVRENAPHLPKEPLIDPSGHPFGFPQAAFDTAALHEAAAIATECGIRPNAFLEKAYTAVLLPLGDAESVGAVDQAQRELRFLIGKGSLEMAFYAGGREAFLLKQRACAYVKASSDLRRIDALVKEEQANPTKWMERIKRPE
jgi:hypothetical protein